MYFKKSFGQHCIDSVEVIRFIKSSQNHHILPFSSSMSDRTVGFCVEIIMEIKFCKLVSTSIGGIIYLLCSICNAVVYGFLV